MIRGVIAPLAPPPPVCLSQASLVGYVSEAAAWRSWLGRAVAGSPEDVQIMYGVAGERRLVEWIADWLIEHIKETI